MTNRMRAVGALLLLLAGTAVLYAQEPRQFFQPVEVHRGRAYLGTSVVFEMEGTTNDAYEMVWRVGPTEDINMIWPAAKGDAGTQLQTTGTDNQQLSWSAAGSSRAWKDIDAPLDPNEALQTVLKTPLYKFHYKRGGTITTGDYSTQYVGPIAEESPQFMHHQGRILNDINTLGYTAGAIQALEARLKALEAQLATR